MRGGATSPLPQGVGAHTVEDRVEPRPDVRTRPETVEPTERAEERLLDEVLGVGGVAGHAKGGPIETLEVGQRFCLESFPVHTVGAASPGVNAPAALPIPAARMKRDGAILPRRRPRRFVDGPAGMG